MAKDCDNTSCGRESCEGCPSAGGGPRDLTAPMNSRSRIGKVIGIMSGKGGVGKSSVTAMLAVRLKRLGFSVGILDADLTGPSIPHLFGMKDIGGLAGEEMLPAESKMGIKIMSVNLLLEDAGTPVIWRGPVLGSVLRQFWSDVVWGDLDYLLIDMPPGTGDVPLTLFQALPMDGVVLVTSPQSLVSMVVDKARNMAEMLNIPLLGVVENYSYYLCPDCGRRASLFGEGRTEAWAAAHHIEPVVKLPLDPAVSELGDGGHIEEYDGGGLDKLALCL